MRICWLRRDLRLSDQRALYEALREAEAQSDQVTLAFVFDTHILDKLIDRADRRMEFIVTALEEIDATLRERGSRLVVLHGKPEVEIPRLARELRATAVHANEDYEPYACKRDEQVRACLAKQGVELYLCKDHVVFNAEEVLKDDGTPYRVFTPYKNAYIKKLQKSDVQEFAPRLTTLTPESHLKRCGLAAWGLAQMGFQPTGAKFQAGEKAAQQKLRTFAEKISQYHRDRDFPAKEGTSQLSVDLRFGTISTRACFRLALRSRDQGSKVWLSELIWREFYQMILKKFPQVETQSFLAQYTNIKWTGHHQHYEAWCEGQTGYPIVDAGMRQLNATGWMHNRVRMIVASFFVKDLLLDWRMGEAYFAQKLLDYDLAANNGGWQWCASTGCDAQPYFRVFNPVLQSLKFDPHGDYIRRWVPELGALTNKAIHAPDGVKPKELPHGFCVGVNYPQPIVEHSIQRLKAVQLYKK